VTLAAMFKGSYLHCQREGKAGVYTLGMAPTSGWNLLAHV
jgi:hypothetical protein